MNDNKKKSFLSQTEFQRSQISPIIYSYFDVKNERGNKLYYKSGVNLSSHNILVFFIAIIEMNYLYFLKNPESAINRYMLNIYVSSFATYFLISIKIILCDFKIYLVYSIFYHYKFFIHAFTYIFNE